MFTRILSPSFSTVPSTSVPASSARATLSGAASLPRNCAVPFLVTTSSARTCPSSEISPSVRPSARYCSGPPGVRSRKYITAIRLRFSPSIASLRARLNAR